MRYSITYMREGWGGSFSFLCCFSSYTITKKVKSKSLWVSEAWSWQKNIAKPEHSGRIWLCHCSRMCRLAIMQMIRIRVIILPADRGSPNARHLFSENDGNSRKNDWKWQSMKEYSANMTEKRLKRGPDLFYGIELPPRLPKTKRPSRFPSRCG